MTEKPIGERVARLEGTIDQTLPMLKKMDEKLDRALELIGEKASRGSVAEAHGEIDRIQLALKEKADKKDVDAVKTEVRQIRDTILKWSGAIMVLAVLASWFGQKLLAMLAK